LNLENAVYQEYINETSAAVVEYREDLVELFGTAHLPKIPALVAAHLN